MRLRVYRKLNQVGEIFTSDQGVCFSYDPGFIASNGYPISLSMPLSTDVYPQSKALPFFDGLLPEGNQRLELSDVLRTPPTSTMKLLAAMAGDCVGDLVIMDEEMDIDRIMASSGYAPLTGEELGGLLRPDSRDRTRFLAARRLSLAGAQPKIGLFHKDGTWYKTVGLFPTTHIIKPVSRFDPSILVNEFLIMRLGGLCNLEVPDIDVIHQMGYDGLAIRRFDRIVSDDGVERIGQEDLCQALSVMPAEKYQESGGPELRDIFTIVRLHTSTPLQDLRKLLRLALFNYLTGNCDAHAKNFSLLRDLNEGALALAPAYDLLCTTFYGDDLSRSMAMSIGKHSRIDRISDEDFAIFADEVGIGLTVVKKEMASLRNGIASSLDDALAQAADELPAFTRDASSLRDHLLQELQQRSGILN